MIGWVVPISMTGAVCFLKADAIKVLSTIDPAHTVDHDLRGLIEMAPISATAIAA